MSQVLGGLSQSWAKGQETGDAGLLHRLDPRGRVVASFLYSILVVSLHNLSALVLAVALSVSLALLARLPIGTTARKVIAMDSFIVFLLVMLPFTMEGEAVFTLWGFEASREGFLRAFEIGLKANAILFALLSLVGVMEPAVLGYALYRLRVPGKLVHLFLFTVRYIDVFYEEYGRLRTAMKARGFEARTNWHTLRSVGYLLGMLLVRSLERSERILAAMKCRGFDGRFHILYDLRTGPRDVAFGVLFFVTCTALIAGEFLL